LSLLLHSYLHLAQGTFPSENGLFTVNYLKGCASTQVELTPTSTAGSLFICFDSDLSDLVSNNPCLGEQPAQSIDDFRFTYEEPGVYNILFLRQFPSSQEFDSITIEIVEPSAPFVAVSTCGDDVIMDVNPEEEIFDLFTLDFGDGSGTQEYAISDFPFSYQYPDPSQSYTLSVVGAFNDSGNNNCSNTLFTRTFVPANQTEQAGSISRVEILTENSFEIEYELNASQVYELQLAENESGVFQTITTFSGIDGGVYTFQSLHLNANVYCARIRAVSTCTNQELLSNQVCTISLTGVAQADGNLLDWNHESFQNSDVLKNGEVIYSGNAPFLDENVLCGQNDLYQIIATDANGIEVTSLPLEIAALVGTPSIPIREIATNVLSESELELSWDVPDGLEPDYYIIYKRRSTSESFVRFDTTSMTSYLDEGFGFDERIFFYSVSYVTACGGISPVVTSAPNILLTVSQSESIINFNWNSYTGFDSLLSNYVLKKYDDNMNLLEENVLDTELTFSEDLAQSNEQLSFYQVEAYSVNGLIAFSNLLRYKIPSSFFVPTAFTPNGDGLNEVIKVEGNFIEEVEFSIYNRWGNLIFRSNALESGWDGFLPNRPAPEGTYSYTVRVQDRYGEEYFKTGVFNLIR
jgi:gliding motility-associated-like protein